jgi:hypothetical protein
MDVVTTYLYGSLDSDIYMKVPDEILVLNTCMKACQVIIRLEIIEKVVVQPIERVSPK